MSNLFVGFALLFFVCTLANASADTEEQVSDASSGGKFARIKCFSCNSFNDSHCDDPFDKEKYKHYAHYCDDLDDFAEYETGTKLPAIGCRKLRQEIPSGNRIIRQCAYKGQIDKDTGKMIEIHGTKRSGSKGVRIFYYQCNGDDCNAATGVLPHFLTVIVGAIFLASMPSF